jgi:PEGA domain
MRLPLVVALATLAACSSNKDKDKDAQPSSKPAEVGELVRSDAGITAVVTAVDPSERHLDEDVPDRPVQNAPQPSRPGRPIDVTLRSSPPGAQVAVDGAVLGHTPAYWSGMADGREHEFVFTMRGYAIARYRFVPIASGVIHGHLDAIHEDTDAGVAMPPPEVMPPRPPMTPSVNPPSAPPTIVQPEAGVTVTPPGVGPAPAPTTGSGGGAPVGPQP